MSDTGSRSLPADPRAADRLARYVALDLDDATLVYDRERPTAWMQSTESVALADCR